MRGYLGDLDELLHSLHSLLQVLVLKDAVSHPVTHLRNKRTNQITILLSPDPTHALSASEIPG